MTINKSSLKRASKLTANIYKESAITVLISYDIKSGFVLIGSKYGIPVVNADRYYSTAELRQKILEAVQKRNLENIISVLK